MVGPRGWWRLHVSDVGAVLYRHSLTSPPTCCCPLTTPADHLPALRWRDILRVHLFVFLPNPANCRKRNFGRNFANSERKENSNSKNEISVNSDRNFGDFDRKMMSVVIFVLFRRSNEKLLNTNFVQFFEIYNFCFRNFFIWAMVWKLFNYFKNYQLKVLSFHVTTSIFSLSPQLDFYYSCYCGYVYKISETLVDLIESCFKSRTNMIWIGYQFMWQCLNFLFDSICIENC